MMETPIATALARVMANGMAPRDTVEVIKTAAIEEFAALDPKMRIHSTDYFNHTFAPDLVLRWSREADIERYVYLRGTRHIERLVEDLDVVGRHHPIIVDLLPLREFSGKKARDRLNMRAREVDTLVTDGPAIGQVAHTRRDGPLAPILSTAFAQGGRGVIDEVEAEAMTMSVVKGYNGARTASVGAIARATELLDERLTSPISARFRRLLQAIWVGSGGRTDLFPASQDLAVGVDEEALGFLLDLELIDDGHFWYRLGRTLSLRQISRLSIEQPSSNLQRLIRANLDHLWARACHLQDRSQRLDEQDVELEWRIENCALALRSPTWIAFVAEKAEMLDDMPGTPTPGVPVDDLRARAEGLILTGLQLSDGREEIDFVSLINEDVAHGDRLSVLAASLGADVRIRRARAAVSSGHLVCDFSRSAISAMTNARPLLAELLGVGAPLLRQMDDEEKIALQDALRPMPQAAVGDVTQGDDVPEGMLF